MKTTRNAKPAMLKYDSGKPDLSMIPYEFLEEVALVLMHGEKTYGRDNWTIGSNWNRAFSAAGRHMFKWWAGEDRDPESGLSHLAHAACNLMFLTHYRRNNVGNDNRPKKTKETECKTKYCNACGDEHPHNYECNAY